MVELYVQICVKSKSIAIDTSREQSALETLLIDLQS